LFSNIYLALAVGLMTVKTKLLLPGYFPEINYTIPILVFFSTQALYSFHKLFKFDGRTLEEKDAKRHRWTLENKNELIIILISSIVGFTICFLFLKVETMLFFLPVGFITLSYSIPVIKTSEGWKRLRDLPFLKIFVISFVFGCMVVLLPVVENAGIESTLETDVLIVFFNTVLFIFAITIPFDLRDINFDKEKKVKTIPLIFGEAASKKIAITALLFLSLNNLVQYFFLGSISFGQLLALFVSTGITGFIIYKSHVDRSDFFYSFLLEGTMIFQFLLV
jgi:4-hydroxybenzoate polyprenyltransferase